MDRGTRKMNRGFDGKTGGGMDKGFGFCLGGGLISTILIFGNFTKSKAKSVIP